MYDVADEVHNTSSNHSDKQLTNTCYIVCDIMTLLLDVIDINILCVSYLS